MTFDELEKLIVDQVVPRLLEKMRRKGADYSGEKDTLRNLRFKGVTGVTVRMGDKLFRMDELESKGKVTGEVEGEPLGDTLVDLINYGLLKIALAWDGDERNPQLAAGIKDYVISLPARGQVPSQGPVSEVLGSVATATESGDE